MLFSYYDRYQYAVNPLVEVICQLRFPPSSPSPPRNLWLFRRPFAETFPATW